MNLRTLSLKLSFALALFLTLTTPVFFPTLKVHFFLPFFICVIYQKELSSALFWSLICGVVIDLLSSNTPLGFHALSLMIPVLLLYSQKQNFFSDKFSTLPLMTYLYSMLVTFSESILYSLFIHQSTISFLTLLQDLLFLPLPDVTYALIFFSLPSYFFGKRVKRGEEYFV